MEFINLTPHVIRLNDGREFQPSGQVARVSATYELYFDDDPNFYSVRFGYVIGLPNQTPDTYYIVSGMVAQAAKRFDVVSPATGHPDCIRKDGQVYSVPGFLVNE